MAPSIAAELVFLLRWYILSKITNWNFLCMTKTSVYSPVDECIKAWAERNSLTLFTQQADREIRCIYVSSKAGECYQIWIDPPDNGEIAVHAACVEGRRDTEGALQDWGAPISRLDSSLEAALRSVIEWMKPSERYFPIQEAHKSFAATYDSSQRDKIRFAWNGKHATEFKDDNLEFRKAVVAAALSEPEKCPLSLISDLLDEEALCSREAWGAPMYFSELLTILLRRGGREYLKKFAVAMNATFDTFGASHAISISSQEAKQFLGDVDHLLIAEPDKETRALLEAAKVLFEKIGNGDAAKGWAVVQPGAPVKNVKILHDQNHNMKRTLIRYRFAGLSGVRYAEVAFDVENGYLIHISKDHDAWERKLWEAHEYGEYSKEGSKIVTRSSRGTERVFKIKTDFSDFPLFRKRLTLVEEKIGSDEKCSLLNFDFISPYSFWWPITKFRHIRFR